MTNPLILIVSPRGEPIVIRCLDCDRTQEIQPPAPLRAVVAALVVFEGHECGDARQGTTEVI